jgi:hypothetical protein
MRISSRTAAATAIEYRDLLEILDDPGARGSILITSQLPAGQWHELELGQFGQQRLHAHWGPALLPST